MIYRNYCHINYFLIHRTALIYTITELHCYMPHIKLYTVLQTAGFCSLSCKIWFHTFNTTLERRYSKFRSRKCGLHGQQKMPDSSSWLAVTYSFKNSKNIELQMLICTYNSNRTFRWDCIKLLTISDSYTAIWYT